MTAFCQRRIEAAFRSQDAIETNLCDGRIRCGDNREATLR